MPQRYNRSRMYGRGYRQYDPTYQAAGFNPAVFEGTSVEFKPYDYSIYERGLANLQARMDEAAEKQGAIDMALANIELQLNPAEREWFAGYKQDIKNQVQGDIDAGNFGSAIRKATKLAGQVASDSKILNRIEYNKAYQQEKDKVLNDKNISQTRKDRWVEENPYNYQDKFDDNGNIIGGTEWNPNWRPYSSLDMLSIYDTVKKLAAVEAGGGESAQFLDENGNLTSDPSKGIYGMAIKRGSTWERLPADKLKRVFDKLFAQIPDAKEALLQQMDDRIWEYNKASDEDKKAFIGSDIVKDDGTFRSPQEYLNHLVHPVLNDMAYNHVKSSVDYGSAYANRAKAMQDQAGRAQLLGLMQDMNNTTFTTPIEIDNQDKAGRSYATIQGALSDLGAIIPAFNNPAAKDFLKNRNYDGLANYLEQKLYTTDNAQKRKAMQALDVLRNEGKTYNRLIAPLGDEEKEAAEFVFAKNSGADLPNAKTNKFSREYAKDFNDIFSYIKNPGSGTRTPVDQIGIQFQDDRQKANVLDKLKLTENELPSHGLEIKEVNGRSTLVVNKNSDKLTDIADAFSSVGNRFWAWRGASLVKFDNNGNTITSTNHLGSSNNAIYELEKIGSNNNALAKATRLTNNTFKTNPNLVVQQTLQVKPFDDYNTQVLNNLWLNGVIEDDDYSKLKAEFKENNLKAVGTALSDLNNFNVYGIRDEKGNLVKLTPKEIEDVQKELLIAYDENRIEISPSDAPTGAGYGTVVKVKGKDAKNNPRSSNVYYVDGLFDGPAAKAVSNDPMFRARHDYQTDRGLGIVENDVVGQPINYDNAEQAIMQYAAKAELNNFYKILDISKQAGQTFTENEAKAEATKVLNASGYSEELNPDEFKQARAKLVSRMLNYYGN